MLGARTKIVLLTSFFAFSFGMLFLALVQNYAHADTSSAISSIAVGTGNIKNLFGNAFVPQFSHRAPSFDLDSDHSLQRYLSTDYPFTHLNYIPSDLVVIYSNFTANNSRAFKLRQEAAVAFADMAWHLWNAFNGDRIYISSAYRSKSFQHSLVSQGCSSTKCAQAGTSEHQAGLAVDIKIISKGGRGYSLDTAYPNKYYDWLKAHAEHYGFHNTYQKGIEIDGKIAEGRHRRYVGVELATILSDKQQTFAEYYHSTNN